MLIKNAGLRLQSPGEPAVNLSEKDSEYDQYKNVAYHILSPNTSNTITTVIQKVLLYQNQ